MKKLFISLCLFMAITSVYAQNFVPDPTKVYNIVETGSKLVVGPTVDGGTQPALMTLKNLTSQAFNFVPTGAPDTYTLLNVDNKYLNFQSINSWDHWNTIFEPTANGLYSEWVIVGADSTGIRLMNNAQAAIDITKAYLGSDGTSVGSSLYCDKNETHWSGLYELKVATVDNSPKFKVSNKVVIEIEKGKQPYPIWISAVNQSYDIIATASAGFTILDQSNTPVDNVTFTPANFTDLGGKSYFNVQETTANVGDTGKVIFSYTSSGVIHKIDSITMTAVATYDRLIIKNNASKFVIGSSSWDAASPVLDTLTIDNGSEQFFLRPVHRNVTDSLYYIIQDGDYKAFMKDPASGYKTQFGILEDSLSVWKITPLANGVKRISSMARLEKNNDLGTDGTTMGNGIWTDKTFKASPTSAPWCEWTFLSVATALDPSSSVLSNVTLSTGFLDKSFNGATTSYNVTVPADVDSVTITGITLSTISTIATNPIKLFAGAPAVLSVVSQDSTSTSAYNFNLVQMTFDKWAAGGETDASKSAPSQWGWKCPNARWASANSTDENSSRYFDNPVNYKYNGVAGWAGRALLINWDGNVSDTVAYSYPVSLEGGRSYTFTGKYAWSSVFPVDYTVEPADSTSAKFTFGINTKSDNSGISVASLESVVAPADSLNFHDAKLTFTPETSGIYYLTIKNSIAIKAAIADLSFGLTTGINNAVSSSVYASVSNQAINVHGTLAGDAVKVYNISGQLVKQLTATSDITSINVKSGVYLIKVNANVLKVIK